MHHDLLVKLIHLTHRGATHDQPTDPATSEEGFEIAQSMGIALLGLGVAAAFATLLRGLGEEIITSIREALEM
jgi:hypothetical protein